VNRALRLSLVVAVAVAAAGATPAHATYTGRNGQIAFVRYKEPCSETTGCATVIATMRADGSGERRLTRCSSAAGCDFRPEWSPDGSRIAFEHYKGIGKALEVMNADGSGRRGLAVHAVGLVDWLDSRHLVVKRGSVLSTVDTRTGEVRHLVTLPSSFAFEVAVHGAKVAFAIPEGRGPKPKPGLYIMDDNGSGGTRLTRGPPWRSSCEHVPAGIPCPVYTGVHAIDWSPDGRKIVFVAGVGCPPGPLTNHDCGDNEIFIIDVASQAFHEVRGNPWTPQQCQCGDAGALDGPTWSPDGRKLLFKEESNLGFTIISPDGSGGSFAAGSPGLCGGPVGEGEKETCGAAHPRWQPTR
jgi:Tol biopolymer transport system component